MALTPSLLERIRAEVGSETRVGLDDDAELEEVYNDADRGNEDVLLTAWFVWKRRHADFQIRAFDVTTGGSLVSRRQRAAFMEARITELEFALAGNPKFARSRAREDTVLSTLQTSEGTELS